MAEPEKPKGRSLTQFAGIMSLASFALAVVLLGAALPLSSDREGMGAGFPMACNVSSFLLTVASFLSGVLALCGARRARGLHISIALGGVIFSGLLLFYGKILHFGQRGMTAREACIANLRQIQGAKATWALEAEGIRHDGNIVTTIAPGAPLVAMPVSSDSNRWAIEIMLQTNAWPVPRYTVP